MQCKRYHTEVEEGNCTLAQVGGHGHDEGRGTSYYMLLRSLLCIVLTTLVFDASTILLLHMREDPASIDCSGYETAIDTNRYRTDSLMSLRLLWLPHCGRSTLQNTSVPTDSILGDFLDALLLCAPSFAESYAITVSNATG